MEKPTFDFIIITWIALAKVNIASATYFMVSASTNSISPLYLLLCKRAQPDRKTSATGVSQSKQNKLFFAALCEPVNGRFWATFCHF